MTGMSGISLDTVSVQGLTASSSVSPVSAAGTQSFDQFLSKGSEAQTKTVQTDTAQAKDVSQDTSLEKSVSQTKRDDLTPQNDTGNVMQSDGGKEALQDTDAAQLQQELRDVVKESLAADDDTIDAALELMGIALTDLLNPDTLQQFVLVVNGGQESTDFLTNEALLSDFMNLSQALEDFSEENASSIVSMMETLDTPVALDEFLQQQGMTALDGEQLADGQLSEQQMNALNGEQQMTIPDTESIVESVTVTRESDIPAETAVAVEYAADTQKTALADPVEISDVTEAAETDTKTEPVIVQADETAGDTEQDSSQEDLAQESLEEVDVLRSSPSETEQTTAPLFAEQFNVLQGDVTNVQSPELSSMTRMQQMVDIVNQVSEQLRSTVSADTTTMEMQLNPESLGKVYLSVVSKAGVMTASFQVQSEEARQALESQMYSLRETLEAKNLKVEAVDVQVSDFSFTQSNEAQKENQENLTKQGKRRFRYDDNETEDEKSVEEVSAESVRRQVMRDTGGSIDFTA